LGDLSFPGKKNSTTVVRWASYNSDMNFDAALHQLALDPASPLDLAELALLLARDEYPDLDVEACLSELDGMAHEAKAYLRGDLQARVEGLCRYLFHEMGFRGNKQEYYDARNSYLNQVLERRKGIPISLSVVAMAVGNRAGLHVMGVGLPGHFVVKAVAEPSEQDFLSRAVKGSDSMCGGREIIFDPFHGGRLLSPKDCEHLVYQVTGETFQLTPGSLQEVPVGFILLRMLNNLKGTYLRDRDFTRGARVIERLRQLKPTDPLQERDLGVCLLQTEQPGKAINHLQAYLKAAPKADDAAAVGRLLSQAEGQVARWN